MAETIISVAVTGNQTTREHHPDLPVTPAEIADSAIKAARFGASIAHIHVRDPQTGKPSMDLSLYKEVSDRIRASGTGMLVNLTTGPGGRWIPGKENPIVGEQGSSLVSPARRVEHVVALKPDICSLDLNTMFSNGSVVVNPPDRVAEMAKMIYAAGVKPELEVFNSGDIHLGRDLIKQGHLKAPTIFQIVLGVKYGASADPTTMHYMKSLLPDDCIWGGFGIGRMSFPMLAQAFVLGGHVRVGFEDNVYLSKGVRAPDNAAMVEQAARIVRDLGGTIATPQDARRILGL